MSFTLEVLDKVMLDENKAIVLSELEFSGVKYLNFRLGTIKDETFYSRQGISLNKENALLVYDALVEMGSYLETDSVRVIKEILKKNNKVKIVVEISFFSQKYMIGIREFILNKENVFIPSRKGLTLSTEYYVQLLDFVKRNIEKRF